MKTKTKKRLTKKQKQNRKKTIALLLAIMAGVSVIGIAEQTTLRALDYQLPEIKINKRPSYKVEVYERSKGIIRETTAYNVGVPAQTDNNPCIGATGENLCQLLAQGEKICAANFVPLETKLYIQNYGICVVKDRMNSRFKNRVDIAMQAHEIERAKKFGLQKLEVKILK